MLLTQAFPCPSITMSFQGLVDTPSLVGVRHQRPVGLAPEQLMGGRRDDQQPSVGQEVDAQGNKATSASTVVVPSGAEELTRPAPQSENHSRPSCRRGD